MLNFLKIFYIFGCIRLIETCTSETTMLSSCSNPITIENNCWYDVTHKNTCFNIKHNKDEKIKFEWEGFDNFPTLLLSWDYIPYIDRNNYFVSQFLHQIQNSGIFEIPTHINKDDFYHCKKDNLFCSEYSTIGRNGTIYASINSYKDVSVNIGRIKFILEKPNHYIKEDQILAIKDLWEKCCKDNFKLIDEFKQKTIGYYTLPFFDNKCYWNLNNHYRFNNITEYSCENLNGIECDKDGNVIFLSIQNKNLNCDIPESFSNLNKIETLSLNLNKIRGNISMFENFSNLKILDISYNYFKGSLPCLNSNNIEYINLEHNLITGKIPSCYKNYNNLHTLILSHNKFSRQPFPSLNSNIQYIGLKNTELYGNIDNISTNFNNLHHLDISTNYLIGYLPSDLFLSKHLHYVDISYNNFYGNLPILSKIYTYANFKHNKLNGSYIPSLLSVEDGSFVDFSYNNFIGNIDTRLPNLIDKLIIILDGNNFNCNIKENDWPRWVNFIKINLGHCKKKKEEILNNHSYNDKNYNYHNDKNYNSNYNYDSKINAILGLTIFLFFFGVVSISLHLFNKILINKHRYNKPVEQIEAEGITEI